PRGRYRERAGGSLHQPRAEPFLQRHDAPAQPRLGNAQGPAGRGEPTVLGYLHEQIHIVEITHGSPPSTEDGPYYSDPPEAEARNVSTAVTRCMPPPRGENASYASRCRGRRRPERGN